MATSENIKFREDFKARLKCFVLELFQFCKDLPKSDEISTIKRQLLRSGSSVYANYRAANRARSQAEFFSKISIVVEEADETEMWLDLLLELQATRQQEIKVLHNESLELLKIVATMRKNTSQKIKSSNKSN